MTAARSTVAHVVLKFDKGGLEMTALNLSRELLRFGHRSVVIALDGPGETFELARSEGIECLAIGERRLGSLGFHRAVRRALRQVQPDIIHTHHFAALLHTAPFALFDRRPRRVHTDHSRLYLAARPDYRLALRVAATTVDRFVVVGDSMIDWYRTKVGIPASKLTVIVNGVDADRYRPLDSSERDRLRAKLGLQGTVIGSIGRYADVKNYPMLIRAVAAAKDVVPDVVLVLVGDGPDRDDLARVAAEAGVGDRVRLVGWQRDPVPWLQAMDVFALSSRSEALPLALLEAMACGLPVLSTSVGDVTGIVRNAHAGITTPPDDEAQYSKALREMLTGDALGRYGAASRVAVENGYSLAVMREKYFAAYGVTANGA